MTEPRFKKKSAPGAPPTDAQGKLLESAQQIWMAGLGAFSRAQDQGSKLFDTLIREGQTIESRTRQFTSGRAGDVRDRMENTVGNVKERAADTWDRLEKVFEDRVSRALTRLGVPGRDEMQALVERVEELNRSIRAQQGASAASAASATSRAKSSAAKAANAGPSGRKAAVKKAVAKKPAARKSAGKKATRKAARPRARKVPLKG